MKLLRSLWAALLVCILTVFGCSAKNTITEKTATTVELSDQELTTTPTTPVDNFKIGAAQTAVYLPLLENKKIALVVNQTSTVEHLHLVDLLLNEGIDIAKIFAPEHGFRGKADAGETVKNGRDAKTGLPLISLYGKNKKPRPDQLEGIDIVVFDIQDVGARFYTYISTMHYVMEACAEQGIAFLVLDRPNPNGHYVDGPVLNPKFRSFVGMHTVPVVHGMTIGEYARMINGEKWLKGGVVCDLKVVPCQGYNHEMIYELPIKPSPNLPNNRSIYLYPSLCFFEGTNISVGRGTSTQFQVFGHPKYSTGNYVFTPTPQDGAKHPKHEGKKCRGYNLTNKAIATIRQEGFNLDYLIDSYQNFTNKDAFFLKNNFFDKLAGTDELRKAILAGKTEEDIRASWREDLDKFRQIREKYLMYP